MPAINWKEKAAALLHDPVFKAFNIKSHEDLASKLCDIAGVPYIRGQEDIIGSSLDRIPLPNELYGKQIRVGMDELKYFIHPISGEKITVLEQDLYSKIADANLQKKYIEELRNKTKLIRAQNTDDEKFYHALWWELGYLTDFVGFMPADTRVPNHSIIDHLEITAALQSCKKDDKIDAALVMFAIGPVQELIAQARKTVDLWAGSYLLSYLTYKAIEYIGINYGFDNIVYPYLRGNAFVYRTLQRQGVTLFTEPLMDEKIASVPNVFLAIVPAWEAKKVINMCEEVVRKSWEELASDILEKKLKNPTEKAIGLKNIEEYKKQIELFPIINSTMIPLPDNVSGIKNIIEYVTIDEKFISEFESYISFIEFIESKGGYKINAGSFYRYVFKVLTSRLNAIKTVRYFHPYQSDEQIGAQRIPDDFGAGVRACVEVLDTVGNEVKRDYLGTVNTVKRFLRDVLVSKKLFDERITFKSVLEIALENDVNKEISEKVKSGELELNAVETQQKLKNGYIAVLMMDGDRMGKLVSGESAPTMSKMLHDKAVQTLKEIQNNNPGENFFFDKPILTPSYQKAISRTLGIFSSLVQYVVEDEYQGMLIYAGGDDVLAILPADKVLPCANKIRKMYSGIGDIELKIGSTTYKFANGVLYKNGMPYTTMMGPTAAMSAGISIINHKSPLRVAIELARKQEHRAKEKLGRSAFSIAIVRRSGQIEEVGSKWEINGMDVIEKSYELYQKSEQFKLSHRSFYKILESDLELAREDETFLELVIEYILRKSDAKSKESEEFKRFTKELKEYAKRVFATSNISERPSNPFDLILTVGFTKRGDKRGGN